MYIGTAVPRKEGIYMDLAVTILGITFSSAAMIALLKIIAIDIVLSGDNAIVIAMATKNLPKKQRNKAIVWGTAGAVILRILFAIIIVWILDIPFVHAIGGILLLWIAYNVLVGGNDTTQIKGHQDFYKAVGTIIVADIAMSLDNVVAVAGAANGHIGMIALGIAISIPIMIYGSVFIVQTMEKYSWIAYIGAGILAWTAGDMIVSDEKVIQFFNIPQGFITYAIILALTTAVLITGWAVNKRAASNEKKVARRYVQ